MKSSHLYKHSKIIYFDYHIDFGFEYPYNDQ